MSSYDQNLIAARLAAMFLNIGKIELRLDPDASKLNSLEALVQKSSDLVNSVLSNVQMVSHIVPDILRHLSNEPGSMFNTINNANLIAYEQSRITGNENEALTPLTSIPSILRISKNTIPASKGEYFYLPKIIDINNVMPIKKERDTLVAVKNAYLQLLEDFRAELAQLSSFSAASYCDSLLYLFERYFCYVPVSTNENETDISLYDHTRSVTAISECLMRAENKNDPFVLVSVDISGIQSFIYSDDNPVQNSKKGTSKRLRGKSFYLVLLTETLATYLLNKMGLSRANLLMNAGGHFILVAPNTAENRNLIDETNKIFTEYLHSQFRGGIAAVMSYLEADVTLYKVFPEWYALLNDSMQEAKRKKGSVILDRINNLSKNLEIRDLVHHYRIKEADDERAKEFNKYEKTLYKLERLFEEAGRGIATAKYFVLTESVAFDNVITNTDDAYRYTPVPFNTLGYNWFMVKSDDDLERLLRSLKGLAGGTLVVFRMNNSNMEELRNIVDTSEIRIPVSYGFRFNGSYSPRKNIIPNSELKKENSEEKDIDPETGTSIEADEESTKYSPVEFGTLASFDENARELSYPLLAVLRLDVDNLGAAFIFGFRDTNEQNDRYSLSRNIGLSRELNLFFAGYVNVLAKEHHIYITYSGGDDLFVVGSWVNILEFGFHLREDFRRFTGNNPDLTMSAGVHFSKDSFPIVQSARLAGEAEDNAKDFVNKDDAGRVISRKDALSIFDMVLSWDDHKKLIDYGKEIYDILEKEGDNKSASEEERKVPASLIHHLLGMTTMMFKNDKIDYLMLVKIKYLFSRRIGINSRVLAEKDYRRVRVLGRLISDNEAIKLLKLFKVPASYAILRNRKSKS